LKIHASRLGLVFVPWWGVPAAIDCQRPTDFERKRQMPLANIKVIEGVFTDSEKRQIIEKVTDALVSVEGERLRDKTVVIVEETRSGDWGIGGKALTTEHVKHARAGG
jgi:4-oxalocrotonate tautomerase